MRCSVRTLFAILPLLAVAPLAAQEGPLLLDGYALEWEVPERWLQPFGGDPHRPLELLLADLPSPSPMMRPALTQEGPAHGSVGSRGHGPGVLRGGIGGRVPAAPRSGLATVSPYLIVKRGK